MGFETKVPPLPRREEEIYAIEKLEESWLNQPYHKYYMNEDVRRPKMEHAERQNKVITRKHSGSCWILDKFLCHRCHYRSFGHDGSKISNYKNCKHPKNFPTVILLFYLRSDYTWK